MDMNTRFIEEKDVIIINKKNNNDNNNMRKMDSLLDYISKLNGSIKF